MELSKKEIDEIARIYDIGRVSGVKLFEGGNISHNFVFRTDKGKFVVRILGYELTEYWRNQKELQYKVLEFLIRKKFPYEVPNFLKNLNGEYISQVEGKLIEAYNLLNGKNVKKLKSKHIKEMAKALAIYHKTIAKFKVPEKFKKIDDYGWIKRELNEMKSVKPKNEIDRVMLSEVDKYIEVFDREKLRTRDLLICHSDFHPSNLLFEKGKLVGMIDFENLHYIPKICDFFFDKNSLSNSFNFFKEYKKHNKVSTEEVKSFVYLKLLGNCYAFRWAYKGQMKDENKRISQMKYMEKKYNKYLEFEKLLKRLK